MSPKLSIVRTNDTCEGVGKSAQIIQLPVTPKLRSIDGGKTDMADRGSATNEIPYTPYHRPNIGIGHHNAQRPWEIQDSARGRVAGVLVDGTFLEHLDHELLAASTTVRRADGVMMNIELTHNAYEKLFGTRLRVPTDIGEYDY